MATTTSNNKMIIEVESDHAKITTIRDGVHSQKSTTISDIQAIFSRDNNLETPLLPGTWGTLKYIASGSNELFLMTTPPHYRDVKYGSENRHEDFKVHIPALLWAIHVQRKPDGGGYALRHTMVYALKNWVLGENDQVYRYPFSNVSDYCCWGSIHPIVNGSKSLTNIPNQFLDGVFNSDLDEGRLNDFRYTDADGDRETVNNTLSLFRYMDYMIKEGEKKGEAVVFPYDALDRSAQGSISEVIAYERRRFM